MNIIVRIIPIILFVSCTDATQKQNLDTSTEVSQLDQIIYRAFIVNVDHLRLRDEPGLQSKTVGSLREHEIVYSGQGPSKLIDTIELRGKKYMTPYWQVSSASGKGWIYGGGLSKIYQGSEPLTFPNSFRKLIQDLNEIEKDKLEVTAWMVDRVTNEDMSDPRVNDVYLKLVLQALDEIPYDSPIYSEAEQIEVTDEMYNQIFDRHAENIDHPYFKKANENGFHIDAGEGMIYPVVSRKKIATILGGPFSESTKAYNEINELEYQEPFMTDAAIYKPLELIAKHLDRRAQYAKKWNHSIWSDENIEIKTQLLNYIKFGASNTPAFNYPDNTVSQEFMISWRNIIKEYASSDWIKELEDWVKLIDQNNGKRPG